MTAELAEAEGLVKKGMCQSFSHGRIARGAEAGLEFFVCADRFLVAEEQVEDSPLVHEAVGHHDLERLVICVAEAGHEIVEGGERLLGTVEQAEHDPLVRKRFRHCARQPRRS